MYSIKKVEVVTVDEKHNLINFYIFLIYFLLSLIIMHWHFNVKQFYTIIE